MIDESTAFRAPEDTPTVIASENANRTLQLTPGTVLGGRYRIVSLIGKGGMGEVYRADDLKLGQTVALKFLARHGDAQRVYEEVRVGRQVSHPNVCRLHDIAEVDGHLFITMEFVDGEDLASLLRRVGRLSSEKALAVSRDICSGLAAAHEKGVIHRDLKPANVMIDGRGRARVTDFGLALAGDSVSDGAGTPAYMAPEQLAGEPASIKTDIYALGLVLYEVFTGRRAFEATSTLDLLARQQRAEFTRPSSVTKDVPAAVERVIAVCLDPKPEARPDSVGLVLRDLPGGDPLAAAIAAGETPSPEMVAAAAKTGDLPAPVAWLMLGCAFVGLLLNARVSERTLLQHLREMKSPDVLEDRARHILAMARLKEEPGDFDLFVKPEPVVGRMTAVYRQSRWPMRPLNPNATLLLFDPPLGMSKGGNGRNEGMANVELDTDGRLLRMYIVPPTVERDLRPVRVNWEPFISAAGYDAHLLTPTQPLWSSHVDTDAKSAWLTKDAKRIEAAAYHALPVSFEVISKESAVYATTPPSGPTYLPERLAQMMFIIFMISIPMAALTLARVNLRRRQVDRAGAMRTASFVFIAFIVQLVFQAHHPMTFVSEWVIVSWHIAQATFWALITALMYIAMEPFVRKRWPQILISWTRLLTGGFTDPMVGRDVLVGAATASATILLWQTTHLISGVASFFTSPATLGPVRFLVSTIAGEFVEAIFRGVGLVVVLVMLRALVRNDDLAAFVTMILVATFTLGDTFGPPALRALYALIASIAGVFLARHLGMLAVMSYAFFVLVQQHAPVTLDTSSWLFARSSVVLILLGAIVVVAFRVALGNRRWLPHLVFE